MFHHMIKSELVQRIAGQNPHLYQRDVENIVNAILGEIAAALACGRRPEIRAVFQDWQGNARASQPAADLTLRSAGRRTGIAAK